MREGCKFSVTLWPGMISAHMMRPRCAPWLSWQSGRSSCGSSSPSGDYRVGGLPIAILDGVDEWEIYVVNEVRDWIDGLDVATHQRVVAAIDLLAETGPGLGRPLVDTIQGSAIPNLKELRPGTVRILFCFDPWRSAILLVAGDKAGRWADWYDEAVPLAEQRYESYLKERAEEQEERR